MKRKPWVGPLAVPSASPSGSTPFLFLKKGEEGFLASGTACVRLGHHLPKSGGGDDGVFADWTWDGQRLQVSVDRYGMHPLYYTATPQGIGISPCLGRLLEAMPSVELDVDALSVFIRLGFFIGEDTPFREIRSMPPNGSLSWDGNRLDVLAPPIPTFSSADMTRDEAIDGYIEKFAHAMERRLHACSSFVLPLTGGRDSRHIFLEAMRQGHPPRYGITTRHLPPRPDEDAEVAKALCSFYGVDHRIVGPTEDIFSSERRKNERTGFCADEHAWLMDLREALEVDGTDSLFDGIGGDVLSAGLFASKTLSSFPTRDARTVARSLFEGGGKAMGFGLQAAQQVLHPRLVAALGEERAIARMSQEVQRHFEAPNPIGSFFFWNRTRREIALSPFSMLNTGARTVFAPYLDHEVFDHLASLPVAMMADHQFHTDTILRAYPEARHLRFENKQAPLRDAEAHYVRFGQQLARWCLRHPRSKVLRPAVPLEMAHALFRRKSAAGSAHYGRLLLYFSQLEASASALNF